MRGRLCAPGVAICADAPSMTPTCRREAMPGAGLGTPPLDPDAGGALRRRELAGGAGRV